MWKYVLRICDELISTMVCLEWGLSPHWSFSTVSGSISSFLCFFLCSHCIYETNLFCAIVTMCFICSCATESQVECHVGMGSDWHINFPANFQGLIIKLLSQSWNPVLSYSVGCPKWLANAVLNIEQAPETNRASTNTCQLFAAGYQTVLKLKFWAIL